MLHGGEESFKHWKDTVDDFGCPELRNTFAYMEMNVDEKQQDLWRRNKYIFENMGQKYMKNNPSFDYPFHHWPLYF